MVKRVAFIHPDLGIGGAEQLVISLAMGLRSKGYEVKIYTPFHDPTHCFPETIDGSLTVEVRGHWFPRSIFGRCIAFCSYMRMLLATLFVVMYGGWFDTIIVDQVSAVMPILKLSRAQAVFYCHFPDKLLSTDRRSAFKRAYRAPLDFLEGFGLKTADKVMVNSEFTRETVEKAFALPVRNNLQVLYPSVTTDLPPPTDRETDSVVSQPFFLSLNRYERKKDVGLAVKAFGGVMGRERCRLVVAGGYDTRIRENVEYFQELVDLAKGMGLSVETPTTMSEASRSSQVVFLKNITEPDKNALLRGCIAVLYTPTNEHFGIVPLEAMVREKPVLASNSGGPKETVVDGDSGFLLSQEPESWGRAMKDLFANQEKARSMGAWARNRVISHFSFQSMSTNLQKIIG